MKIDEIGILPKGAHGASFARAALAGNFLYRHTSGGVLTLDKETNTVYLLDRDDDAQTDAAVRIWRERLDLGKEER